MTKIQNIVSVLWEYENKKWETKKNYHTIGKLITKEDWNQFIKLDVIPTNWEWYANIYDIKAKEEKASPAEDLPFR